MEKLRDKQKNNTKKFREQKCEENQLYGYFKRQIKDTAHEMIWTGLRKFGC